MLILGHKRGFFPLAPSLGRGKATRGGITVAITESGKKKRALGRTGPSQCPPRWVLTQMRKPKKVLAAWPGLWGDWIVIYCFIISDHKCGGLK